MGNKRKFFYNGIMLTLVGIAMRTAALFFNAFITKTIGAEGTGLYTVVMTVYGFAVTFATSGISLTVTKLVASAAGERKEHKIPGILSGAVLYAFSFSFCATVFTFFGAGFLGEVILGDERAVSAIKILSPSLIPLSMIAVFSGYFVGVRRVGCNALTQIASQIFKIGATVWLVLRALPLDVEEAAKTLAIGATMTELIAFFVLLLEFVFDRRKRREDKKTAPDVANVAKIAVPLGISAYIRQALVTLEHILIPNRLRKRGESLSQSLASYGTMHGLSLPLILYPMVILSSFAGLLVPEFAERSASGSEASSSKVATKAIGTTLVYATLASAVLFTFSEELGYVIYGSYEAGRYVSVLAPIVPIMYLDHVTDSILKGIGEEVYSMWVNVTDALLSVLLVWILIPRLGILGYAVCIIVMEGYNFVLSFLRLRKRIKLNICFRKSVLFPLLSALFSSYLVKSVFISAGSSTSALWLVLEISFSVAIFVGIFRILLLLDDARLFDKFKIRQQ